MWCGVVFAAAAVPLPVCRPVRRLTPACRRGASGRRGASVCVDLPRRRRCPSRLSHTHTPAAAPQQYIAAAACCWRRARVNLYRRPRRRLGRPCESGRSTACATVTSVPVLTIAVRHGGLADLRSLSKKCSEEDVPTLLAAGDFSARHAHRLGCRLLPALSVIFTIVTEGWLEIDKHYSLE